MKSPVHYVVRSKPLPKVEDFCQLDPTKLLSEAAFRRTYQPPCRWIKYLMILAMDPCAQVEDWQPGGSNQATLHTYSFCKYIGRYIGIFTHISD